MDELVTSVVIHAPAAAVWGVLTDFARYPEWNRRMRIAGEPEVGARLHVTPGPDARRMPSFRPRVTRVVPGRELRWVGHLLVPGLFDGEHRFVAEDAQPGRSRFTQAERFSGALVGPVLRRYGRATEEGFLAVNEALKARAELLAGAGAEGPAGAASLARPAKPRAPPKP